MDIEKIVYILKDIRKRVSADNAEALDCAIELAEKQKPKRAVHRARNVLHLRQAGKARVQSLRKLLRSHAAGTQQGQINAV